MANNVKKQADWFYNKNTSGTAYIVEPAADADNICVQDFGFRASEIKIKTAGTLQFSFDGKNDHGEIASTDGWVSLSGVSKGKIYLKSTAAAVFTIMAWSTAEA